MIHREKITNDYNSTGCWSDTVDISLTPNNSAFDNEDDTYISEYINDEYCTLSKYGTNLLEIRSLFKGEWNDGLSSDELTELIDEASEIVKKKPIEPKQRCTVKSSLLKNLLGRIK